MAGEIVLRDVVESDLPIMFEYQCDPDANRMAAFPPRDREAFDAHMAKVMANPSNILKAVVFNGDLAGSIFSWEQDGRREIGYWLGQKYWGKGIASAALAQFLAQVATRPLVAHAAKHNLASVRVLEKNGFTISYEETTEGTNGAPVAEIVLTLDK